MATRIRTLNFLPEVFQTQTNAQFLSATLDQVVDQPNTMRIQGYIGSKFGYGVNAKNKYVIEPTKIRTDYQLDPGVVFLKNDTGVAQDFISYPGILDALKVEGSITDNNNRLFESQFYSWDSFTNLDKIINFNQYYWLPEGPEAVQISTDTIYSTGNYIVESVANGYSIGLEGQGSTTNPVITLLRGGSYTFTVNQATQFWIQGAPGITGFDPNQPNIQTREVFGVINNGASNGVITFNVPEKNAQDEYDFPGNNSIDVVSTLPFDQVNGASLQDLQSIDGVSALEGLTVMFYNTGIPDEQGFVGPFYDTTLYDQDGGNPYTYPGTSLDDTNYEGGYYTQVSATFYQIVYTGSPSDTSSYPILKLIPVGSIPTNEKIIPKYGTEWVGRTFYRNTLGTISLVPYISAPKDILYYQDGTYPNKVGQIKLIENNNTNRINVNSEILGKKYYTSSNGIVFTNGLKVTFSGDIYPTSYKDGEYYVEGVGTAIELIPTSTLIAPEIFTEVLYTPYDILPYDVGSWDGSSNVPVLKDYITISRNSLDKNAWTRSNRWFHIDVINATATYNNKPELTSLYATQENKAKRPIIEFYPNLRLFNSGTYGKPAVDFMDFRTTDAFTQVAGQTSYYPDTQVWTNYTASIVGNSNPAVTTTTITVDLEDVTGSFVVGQYITDSTNLLPNNTQITDVIKTSTEYILTVSWVGAYTFSSTTVASIVGCNLQLDEFSVYPGARIVFANDTNLDTRNKIYEIQFSQITPSSTPIITLTEVEDGNCDYDTQVAVNKGFQNAGKDFYYGPYYNIVTNQYDIQWTMAQEKLTVNQPPKFDIFDADGISFGNKERYNSSSFTGSKLFAYGIGFGTNDVILGFPIRYSGVSNTGDISFDISINIETFDYVKAGDPKNQRVNTGYVHRYNEITNDSPVIGWQTAVGPSVQYQLFQFNYIATNPTNLFVCDVPIIESSPWPTIQLFVNNVRQSSSSYTFTVTDTQTIVNFTVPDTSQDTIVEILLLSDSVSQNAYYTIPINLSNNPFNADVQVLNVGDIRNHYTSIFYNCPLTTGQVYGSNNFRDLGNIIPYGTAIIQNSASLVLPSTFLRKQDHNLFNALLYNSREYINYKNLLVYTVSNTAYEYQQTPAQILDDALDQITSTKGDTGSFFWSDMLPSKAPYASNTYTFANAMDVTRYPLSAIYDFTKANYNGVLVYLTRLINNNPTTFQLIINKDYIVSSDAKSLTVTLDLQDGDIITINEYNQTYGSYVPNTPTKLGFYPSTIPSVVLDTGYNVPSYFILGHDGSYTKLYGNYDPETGRLDDFRDQVLLEFEQRIYNNLKLVGTTYPVNQFDVLPGFFRDTEYSYDDILEIYTQGFLNWVGQNRIDYKTQYYNPNNEYTYNYNQSGNKINRQVISQGYWRGIYQYFYDTANPDTMPWQMLGYTDQPDYWETRYGPAPYTSDNTLLWSDLAAGKDYGVIDPITGEGIVRPNFVRPELLQVLPVDSAGNLVSPFISIMGDYDGRSFKRDWRVGDVGPAEFSYRRSSTWPFDLMRILALTKPANFFNLGVDLDNYRYNPYFNQYLVNDISHLVIDNVEIYGNGTAKTSYINWIVDYEKQIGIDATNNIKSLLFNLDVRLVYRLAGFSDKTNLQFYVEKGSVNSTNSSLLIPDESYSVLLYDNEPFDRIVYSGVIVQLTKEGTYKVYGNSQTNTYFKILPPINNGSFTTLKVEEITVQIATNYYSTVEYIPYGNEFYTVQEVAQFLESYGRYLAQQGAQFETIEAGIQVSWRQMSAEFLYWAQSGWEPGSIVNLNPSANILSINKDGCIVQPLTLQQQNFILNQNNYPILLSDLDIQRDGTSFIVKTLNQGDTIAYGQFNISNFEHGIVFNNLTLFDDVIYNLVTGLRQNRVYVRGTKTAEWNGTITAQGFILNQDNILAWNKDTKYTKGSIVKYKNKYWTALKIIQPAVVFQENLWKETDYNEIQKGLLPNTSTRSYESTLYYDVNQANLEQDADLLSFSLIGYRPRDYLALVDLTDITQINVYKNLIKNKGTRNSINAFKGANLPQGGIQYDLFENWAIKTGEYGGVLNNNFFEVALNSNLLTGNPSIVGLMDGTSTEGVQQEVPLYQLVNYSKPITSPDVLPTLPVDTPDRLLPSAGYVNINDVKTYSYYYSGLPVSKTPLTRIYVGEYIWVAEFQGTWQIFAPLAIAPIVGSTNNLNGTVNIIFETPHNLQKNDPVIIINFDVSVNGYYIVSEIVNNYTITIPVTIPPSLQTITGSGVGLKLQNQRIEKPSDINNLPLINFEFVKNKVWVDNFTNGDWATLQKSLNYQYTEELTKTSSSSYGSAVAASTDLGYLISDADLGEVYRYIIDPNSNEYFLYSTYTEDASFGATIEHSQNIVLIAAPTYTTPYINVYELIKTTLENKLSLIQNSIYAPSGVTNFGSAIAFSGDTNWIYVSAYVNNQVYVYNKNYVTNKYTLSTIISIPSSVSGDNFGYSLSTDYYGTTLIVGAPNKNYNNINDSGEAYIFDRLYQTFEAQYSNVDQPQKFNLVNAPTTITLTLSNTTVTTNRITTAGSSTTSGVNLFDPITFTGTAFGGVSNNLVYYISDIVNTSNFTIASNKYTGKVIITLAAADTITLESTDNLVVDRPIQFFGNTDNSNIQENTKYFIRTITTDINGDPAITIKDTNGTLVQLNNSTPNLTFVTVGPDVTLTTASGTMYGHVQSQPVYVNQNGKLLSDNEYAIVGTQLWLLITLTAGDIINIDTNKFILAQTVNPVVYEIGEQFGKGIANNTYATEVLIGAPLAISQTLGEGAVYRYTNSGSKFGYITGTQTCNLLNPEYIFINGYSVYLPSGGADTIANAINSAKVTNVQAVASNGILTISLIDVNIASATDKLNISVNNGSMFNQLGFNLYTLTQTIKCPHAQGASQFGSKIKFNEFNSFVVSAPVGTRYALTTFDFVDDSNYNNDTLFDNNTTQFLDWFNNTGAVYMYDYLENYNESLDNLGVFVYAQSINSRSQQNGVQPLYGSALEFNNGIVLIGAPNYLPDSVRGQVIVYTNETGEQDWSVFRHSCPVVDVSRIENIQIYNGLNFQTLANLDYFDPLQGKLLGVVVQNIDYITNADPASYNSPATTVQQSMVWGAAQIGSIWLNTSSMKFMNYHQNDVVYNSKYWGKVFPGSLVEVYTWIYSTVPPIRYQGPGIPYDLYQYSISYTPASNGQSIPNYFFWVKNSNIIYNNRGKTLTDVVIQNYILTPQASGIAYFAPLQPNVFALYNTQEYVAENTAILHVGFGTGVNDDVIHNSYSLIRANYPDDFLPGLPGINNIKRPESLYNRMLESFSGVDEAGAVVPDPYLPKLVQTGVLARPRQSFFYNRFTALQNYLEFANLLLKEFPAYDLADPLFLFVQGDTNPSNNLPFFDVQRYWEFITWWAPGYNDSTKSNVQVQIYSDLLTLTVPVGTVGKVLTNADGFNEWYVYTELGTWERIGLQNGTIQFKPSLWDYTIDRYGFGDNFFDTTPYDEYPSEETRFIIRALNEQLPTEYNLFRNQALILMFEYIQSETIEYQNYLPWLNKTSLVDVSHTIRELKPIQVYQTDNQDFLAGYINEVKPYHVVVKDFLFKYTGIETFAGDLTDFDLPAKYNTDAEQFITPQLVYQNPDTVYEYLPTNEIWNSTSYNQWYQNFGLSLTGHPEYPITTLASYVTLNSNYIIVDNPWGFPIDGTIKIYDPNDTTSEPTNRRYELIGYTTIDKATNTLSGLTRGVNGTPIFTHLPGEEIYIDLPAVVLLESGRGYTNPPQVTAHIDTSIYPAPRRPAVLQAVMYLDKILRIDVIDPGSGYTVLPEIVIEPAATVTVLPENVKTYTSTMVISTPIFNTGDLVKYVAQDSNNTIGGLVSNQYYYVNALETSPAFVIGLYTNYADSINDTHRVKLYTTGSGNTNKLLLTGRASCISSSYPIRENIITLKYDRIAYNSQVTEWNPGTFYGSFYAGKFSNSTKIASSAITLQSTQPPIEDILASAEGQGFEMISVSQDYEIKWSSRTRNVTGTVNVIGDPDLVTITESEGGTPLEGYLGPTTGFYIGMPVKFTGAAFGGLTVNTTYYIETINGLNQFSLVDENSNPVVLTTASAPVAGLTMYVGEPRDIAVVTMQYPGILSVTATASGTNYLTIPLTLTGQGGTTGFYSGLLVYFTGNTIRVTTTTSLTNIITCTNALSLQVGNPITFRDMVIDFIPVTNFGNIIAGQTYYVTQILSNNEIIISETINGPALELSDANGTCVGSDVFGGVVENTNYYITSIVDKQTFTMSKNNDPVTVNVIQTTTSTNIITLDSDDTTVFLSVNDPIIFSDMIISSVSVSSFGNIVDGTVYYISEIVSPTTFKISTTINGPAFALSNATGTCIGTNQKDTVKLYDSTGSMTINIGLPISPGQINGQQFTMYPTSQQYPNKTGTNITLIERTITNTISASNRIILKFVPYSLSYFYNNLAFTVDSNIGNLVTSTPYYVISNGITTVTVTNTSSTGNKLTCNTTDYLCVDMPIVFTGVDLGGINLDQEYFVDSIVDSTHFTIKETLTGSTLTLTNDNGTMILTGSAYLTVSTTKGGSTFALADAAGLVALNQYIVTTAVFDISYILGGYRAIITTAGAGYAITNQIKILGTAIGGTSPQNDLVLTVNSIDGDGAITSAILEGTPNEVTAKYYLKVINVNQLEVYSDPLMQVPVSYSDFNYEGIRSTTVTAVNLGTNRLTVSDISQFSVNDPVVFTNGSTDVIGGMTLGNTYYIINIVGSTLQISATIGGSVFALNATTSGLSFNMAKSGDYIFLPEPFYFNQSIVKYNNRVYQCIVSNNDFEFVLGKWEELLSSNRRLNALDRIVGYYKPEKSNTLAWNDYINMPGNDLTQLVSGITYPNGVYFGNAFAPDEEFPLDTILNDQPFYPIDIDSVAVAWDGNKFVTASNTPKASEAIISVDGVSWNLNVVTNSPANFTDIVYANGIYVITANNNVNPMFISQDGVFWTTTGRFTPYDGTPYDLLTFDFSSLLVESNLLNSVTYTNNAYIAVGENIVKSTNPFLWQEKYAFTNGLTNVLYGVSYVSITNFIGLIAVGKGQILSGLTVTDVNLILQSIDNGDTWTNVTSYFTNKALYGVTSGNDLIVVVGQDGIIYTSINGFSYAAQTSGTVEDLNDVIYADGLFVVVGNSGKILISSDGSTWTSKTSNTTNNLNGITYDDIDNKFIVVGDNNTILTSIDNCDTWESISIFETDPTFYNVEGGPFLSGYGPEELVPGVVTDNLTMLVNTRPGTTWEAVEYGHVGYKVVSVEIPMLGNDTFSFFEAVQIPAELSVFIIDSTTGLSTSIYEGSSYDYAIDWISQTITLNNPGIYNLQDTIRIDVYAVGNGNELVKSNTNLNPILTNQTTGFNEIELNCNYSKPSYLGSGVVRPGTEYVFTNAISTDSLTNEIECYDVTVFTLNAAIKFQGTVFGGLVADTIYYVKSVGYKSKTISVSSTINNGIAGPIYSLSTATGNMTVDVIPSVGAIWTDPYIMANGNRLTMGFNYTITETRSATNTVVCQTTSGMVGQNLLTGYPGDTITFGSTIFGTVIDSFVKYNILQVIDTNEFTIEDPLNPGNPLVLTDASGSCTAITHDVSYGLSANGITAKLIFADSYNQATDYISYTVFGETTPEQYGYTLPETQLITTDVSLDGPYDLENYVGGSNPDNAVVELDGLRIAPSNYNINYNLSTITFNPGVVTSAGQNVAVTSYNLTDRQYFNTQVITASSSQEVYAISYVYNTISLPLATTTVTSVTSTGNVITCDSTSNFVVGQTIIFKNSSVTPMGNIQVDGTVYFILNIINSTDFTISQTLGGPAFDPGTASSPLMIATVGGQPAIRVQTSSSHTFTTNDIIRIDDVLGSVQLNNNTYYVHVISDTLIDLYTSAYLPSLTATNDPLLTCSAYISGGYIWNNSAYIIALTTVTATSSTNNLITVVSTEGLVIGTPVIFTGTTFGNIIADTVYYVKEIDVITPNTFTISSTRYGDEFVLSNGSGTMNVTQWEQDDTDRLWVTINGYRVPSSSMKLNANNYLSILTPIMTGDEIIITSMIFSATPDEETYLQIVNKNNVQVVYRENTWARTWLTEEVSFTSDSISVYDVTRITNSVNQTVTAPAAVDGVITVGLTVDKNTLIQATVYNQTTSTMLNTNQYSLGIFETAPVVNITSGVTAGDILEITSVEGNTILVNGEQIRFGSVDFATNSISDLSRGVNGTGVRTFISAYSTVYSILTENLLNPEEYNNTWNSNIYNTTEGDPLQISQTDSAIFLNQDIY